VTQTLNSSWLEAFFDVEYDVPSELTQGKSSVVVRFDGQQNSITGGVYGCFTLKVEP